MQSQAPCTIFSEVRTLFEAVVAPNSVIYVRSDIIRSRHAFATRIGGVSREEHTSALNLAFGRGDSDCTVLENLSRFAEAVGFDKESVISLPQIHSANVVEVGKADCGRGYFKKPCGECDGYVTAEPGVTLGVKTADCVPIILEAEDENGRIIAVSALHAGWRGTVAGIAENGVKALISKGAAPFRIRAAIGPSIGSCCFEVGEEFPETVEKLRGKSFAEKFVTHRGERFFADIKGMNFQMLVECGVPVENIDLSAECTYCLEDKYYSHRRMRGVRGTMLSVVEMSK